MWLNLTLFCCFFIVFLTFPLLMFEKCFLEDSVTICKRFYLNDGGVAATSTAWRQNIPQIEVCGLQGWFFKHALKYRLCYFKNSVSFSSPKFNRICLSGWFYDIFGKRILICRFDVDEKRKNTISHLLCSHYA